MPVRHAQLSAPEGTRNTEGRPLERLVTLCVVAFTFVFTLLRGVRWPNDWAEAHWMVGYQEGFIKRGLPGEVFRWVRKGMPADLDIEMAVRVIASAGLLASSLVLLGYAVSILVRSKYSQEALLFVLLFATSTYLPMSAHLIGYYDGLAIVIAWLAMRCVLADRSWWAGSLLAVGMLCHETLLLVGLPSVVFCALLLHCKAPQAASEVGRPRGLRFGVFARRYAPLFLLPGLVFLVLVLHNMLYFDRGATREALVLSLAEYPFVGDERHKLVPWAITLSFLDYLQNQSPKLLGAILLRQQWIQIGLPMLACLLLCMRKLRGLGQVRWLGGCLIAITILPLALHAIAWDVARIWTYPMLVVIMGYWAICQVHPQCIPKRSSPWVHLAIAALIVLQFFHRAELMDGEVEHFSNELRALACFPVVALLLYRLWPGRQQGARCDQ